MAQRTNTKGKYTKKPILKQVVSYLLIPEALITLIPFSTVLISILFELFKASYAAEFIFSYISLPLFIISPIIITLVQINTLKRSFPRNADEHKVILSVMMIGAVSFVCEILLFVISCYSYSAFPLKFISASYIRDMIASSPAAMIIAFITIFALYCLISLMTTAAFFIGESTKKKYSFTLSCLIFILMYIVLLVIFILAYFLASFMDIKALELIEISNSFLNSSMLCSFITFIFISIPALPILYRFNYKALKKK